MPTNYNLSNIADITWGDLATEYVHTDYSANANFTSNAGWISNAIYERIIQHENTQPSVATFNLSGQTARNLLDAMLYHEPFAITYALQSNKDKSKINVQKEIEGKSDELDTFLKSFHINNN